MLARGLRLLPIDANSKVIAIAPAPVENVAEVRLVAGLRRYEKSSDVVWGDVHFMRP